MTTLWEIESEFIKLIAQMRTTGIKIDREFCKPKVATGERILNQIKTELGWNPGSTKDLGHFLLEEMQYPVVRKTPKGNPSFDKYAMEEYDLLLENDQSPVAHKIFRYRGWQKTVSSNYKAYLELADKDDILHPNYKLHGTVTGRLSCEKPNLQQIPRESEKEWNGDLKQAFIPRSVDSVLVEFDFSQLELRLAAAASGETSLLIAFANGVDAFDSMAERLGWPRQHCKTFTYATLYGAGINRIAFTFNISYREAKARLNEFYSAYPRLGKTSKDAERIAQSKNYIEYWSGRRRHLTSDYRKAFNAYVQGGAYEIVKRSGLRLQKEIETWRKGFPLVLTVHDSYVLEMPVADYNERTVREITNVLEAVPESKEMGVHFKVDSKKWGEK